MPIQPRSEILSAPPAHHGAFDYAELERLGLSPDEVIDFSVNSNPYGPPPGVREAIANVPLDRYPDRECIALRRKLAERHDVGIENIVVGNGTAELLLLIAMAFIRPGDNVLIVEPTFGEYERVARLAGGHSVSYFTEGRLGYAFDAKDYVQLGEQLSNQAFRVLFCCTPNNPTGRLLNPSFLHKYASRFPDVLIVIDGAYALFASHENYEELLVNAAKTFPNVLFVQSLTKHFALAGLRLGYVVGNKNLIDIISAFRPAWNVNAFAQAAGIAALETEDHLRDVLAKIRASKSELVDSLKALGMTVLPSNVNYFLVRVGNAAEFRAKLLQHKIMVRDCTSFGLPEYVRIATRTPDDNAKLLAAVEAVQA